MPPRYGREASGVISSRLSCMPDSFKKPSRYSGGSWPLIIFILVRKCLSAASGFFPKTLAIPQATGLLYLRTVKYAKFSFMQFNDRINL